MATATPLAALPSPVLWLRVGLRNSLRESLRKSFWESFRVGIRNSQHRNDRDQSQ
ncbi:hypothetical protein GGF45_001528, partial [Coemansia sp. RSA 551]